jgi:NAD-dependent SIR2 family protein deacetylase
MAALVIIRMIGSMQLSHCGQCTHNYYHQCERFLGQNSETLSVMITKSWECGSHGLWLSLPYEVVEPVVTFGDFQGNLAILTSEDTHSMGNIKLKDLLL